MTGDLLDSWFREGGAGEVLAAGADPKRMVDQSRLMEIASQPALERLLDWFIDEVAGGDQVRTDGAG
jgi:hypothetical protein